MRNAFIAILVLFALPAHAGGNGPTPEQTAWFNNLSSGEVAKLQEAYDMQQREARWKEVKVMTVTEAVLTSRLVNNQPSDNVTSGTVGHSVTLWWAIATPKDERTPKEVKVRWIHDGKEFQTRLLSIEKPSPHYRLWDITTPRATGAWTVEVLVDNMVYVHKNFSVS